MPDYRNRPPVDAPREMLMTIRRAVEIATVWIAIPAAGYFVAVALGLVR